MFLVNAGKAPAAWTPASLGAALIAWYKADAGTFHDAGVTPATNGQTVVQWNDQSGNNYHLTGPIGQRPVLLTNTLNSLPVLQAAGNEKMTTGSAVALGGTVLSVFNLNKVTAQASTSGRVLGVASAGGDIGADATIAEYLPGSSLVAPTTYNNGNKSTGTIVSASWNQIGTIFDGANDIMYIANSAQTGVAAAPTFAATVDIQLWGDATLSGQMAEIVITNTALSSSDRNSLTSYLTAKWGI